VRIREQIENEIDSEKLRQKDLERRLRECEKNLAALKQELSAANTDPLPLFNSKGKV
jgi:chromosome segregation ATPase